MAAFTWVLGTTWQVHGAEKSPAQLLRARQTPGRLGRQPVVQCSNVNPSASIKRIVDFKDLVFLKSENISNFHVEMILDILD